ncbi:hypothetical protein, partial [Rhizobium alarense]
MVVALFAALLAPFFIDWTSFRQDFEREASRILGRKVVVHGSVDARILPFPSVTLSDVRVGEEDGRPMIEVARFSMDAELAPFLSGEALIFDMRVEEPKARVRLFPDGTLDWARGRRTDIPAKTVVLEKVTISGGEIEFVDEQTGRTRHVTDLSANVAARSLAGPWRVDGRGALDGAAGAFQVSSGAIDEKGALRLRAAIVPDALAFNVDMEGDLKLVEFRPRYDGTFTVSERRDDQAAAATEPLDTLRVTGGFELSNERLRVPDYRLELGDPADPYIVTGEATLDTGAKPDFLLTADGQQIDVNRIGNSGESGKTGRDSHLSARQRLQALLAIAADIPVPQVPGEARISLPAILIGDTTIRDVALALKPDGDGWLVERGTAQLPGRTTIEADGRLTLKENRAFVGNLLVASNQPSGFAAWAAGSVDPEIRRLKTAGFSARVNLTDELQRFENLEFAVDSATLTGRAERESPVDGGPSLSLELKGNSIDVASLRALTGMAAGDSSLATLLDHSIALDLKVDRLQAFSEDVDGVDAVVALKDGRLSIERLRIDSLAGAALAVDGNVGGALDDPAAGLRMTLRAAQMRPFAALLSRHLPPHPALARFLQSAGYYDGADLAGNLSVADGAVAASVSGTAGEGRLDLRLSAPSLADLTAGRVLSAEATLENPRTVVLAGQLGLDPLPFDAEENGIVTARIDRAAEGPAAVSFAFTTDRTSLTMEGEGELSADNFLTGTYRVAFDSEDAEPYLLMNGIALPQTGLGLPAEVKGNAAVTEGALTLTDVSGRLDGNALSGDLSLERGAGFPRGTGRLSVDAADFDWLAEAIIGPLRDESGGTLNGGALGRPAWDAADVAIDLSATRFTPGLFGPVDGLTARLVWHGADLSLEDLKGRWLGGSVSGRVKLAKAEENGLLEARLELADVDLAELSWSGEYGPVLTGRGDLTIALDASGTSVDGIARSASGSGVARLHGVKVMGLDTMAFPALLSAADAMEGEITPERVEPIAEAQILKGETLLGGVSIPFSIVGGTLRVQSVSAGDGAARLTGAAEIGLVDRTLAARTELRFRAGEEALAGAEPEVSLAWSGPLDAPALDLGADGLANYLSLRKFEIERRRVETLQANVLEKQRLRREAALYKARTDARAARAEAIRLQDAEEERRRTDAQQRLQRQRDERAAVEQREEQRRREADEARRMRDAEEAARRLAEERAAQEAGEAGRDDGAAREELPPVSDGLNLN